MRDSSVWVYDGTRGSGKTLSAAWECAMRMINENEIVISNVPIAFELLDDNTGELTHYESKPLNIDNVVTMADEYRNATIFWDEMSLWVYSRSSAAVLNRLVTLVFTMMRKRKLSFIITTQATRFIDNNVRFQMDTLISCFDMSYRWPYTTDVDGGTRKRKRGELICQNWKDISGINTGVSYNDDGHSYTQYFRGYLGWGIYDTDYEFDVLEAQTKYRTQMGTKLITRGEVKSAMTPSYDQIGPLLNDLPPDRYRTNEIEDYLKTSGIEARPHILGRYIKKAGWEKHRDDDGYFYEKVGSGI